MKGMSEIFKKTMRGLKKLFLLIFLNAKSTQQNTSGKTTGILNEGKNNKFINNEFTDFDIGIHDKGEGTTAIGNKFSQGREREKWHQTVWGALLVAITAPIIVALILKYIFHI